MTKEELIRAIDSVDESLATTTAIAVLKCCKKEIEQMIQESPLSTMYVFDGNLVSSFDRITELCHKHGPLEVHVRSLRK